MTRRTDLLALALWAGIVTGGLEVAAIVWPLLGPDFGGRSRDVAWMTPAVYGVLFLLVGLAVAAAARAIRIPWRVAAGGFAALGILPILLLFPTLHWAADLVVAAGVGSQVARVLRNREVAAARKVRQSLPWFVGAIGLTAVLSFGWRSVQEHRRVQTRPAARDGLPNVLLLILDTVRARNLSLYHYARSTTPELERFARHATVFDLAFAPASWTAPSHASMFTGHWTFELDIDWSHSLGPQWQTLAEVLHDRGYATAAFVANQAYVGWESGLMQGFEHREDYPPTVWTAFAGTVVGKTLYPPLCWWARPKLRRLPLLWRMRLPSPGRSPSAAHINGAFLEWLDRTGPKPFFAFLNFMDAHAPYTVPDSFRWRFHSPKLRPVRPAVWQSSPAIRMTPADARPKLDQYDGSLAYLDSQLGHLFGELERRHLLENTLVVLAADHGDEFAEHGLMSHGVSLYRRVLHVPLLISFPGHVPEGQRVTAAVSLRNLAATILDLAIPGETVLPGRSLARFWTGADTLPDTLVAGIRRVANNPDWYPASRGELNSITFEGLKYIRNEGDGTEELYDFNYDLLERWNIVETDSGSRLLPRYRDALAALQRTAAVPSLAGK